MSFKTLWRAYRSIILGSAALLSILLLSCFSWQHFLVTPLIEAKQEARYFIFSSGISAKKVGIRLKKQQLISSTVLFNILIKFKHAERALKPGEYLITPGVTTPSKLIDDMVAGRAIRHAFTIVEGWTFKQLLAALNSNNYLDHVGQHLTHDQIMAAINHPGEMPEGRFAPDTYLFSGRMKDLEILTQAYQLMQKRLQQAWQSRSQVVACSCPYQALIIASLIEKETANDAEKPIIAGVIWQRLAINMPLQIDPTVIYGLGDEYHGKLIRVDFSKHNAYNTYMRKGLPPTPIAMPSQTSIQAALNPVMSNYLYYVAKGDGTHHFSATFPQQLQAIKKYLKR